VTRYLAPAIALALVACAAPKQAAKSPPPAKEAPFAYRAENFITVSVLVNDSIAADFVLDTGAGLNLISSSLCRKLNCELRGVHSGKRMSGQRVKVPLTQLDSLTFAGRRLADVTAGVFDIDQLMPGQNIDGFLSLDFFRKTPFTIDYKSQMIKIEDEESLKAIRKSGAVVPVKLDKEGPSLGVLMPLQLPDGQTVSVEVDTGSQALILNDSKIRGVGLRKKALKSRQGKDETGHVYMRYFGRIPGTVRLPDRPEYGRDGQEVMFQKIIYDGLIGQYFLREFLVTFDLAKAEMIFRKMN
jgi:hypothetical protein